MLKTVGLQVALVLVAAACGGLYWGALGARDILLGGFACVLPNLLFARLLAQAGRRSPGTFVAAFLVGEFIKLALTVATLLAIVIWVKPACWAALLVGIVAALQAPWLQVFFRRQYIQTDTGPGASRRTGSDSQTNL